LPFLETIIIYLETIFIYISFLIRKHI